MELNFDDVYVDGYCFCGFIKIYDADNDDFDLVELQIRYGNEVISVLGLVNDRILASIKTILIDFKKFSLKRR